MFETPILFIVFNRPDITAKVFTEIKKIKPAKLFIAADGPRLDRIGEEGKCQQVRQDILNSIDWQCEIKTLFRDENLGCGKAVSSAITWFFQNVEQGIILEDDCLPDQSFFGYCDELLDYYKDNSQVMMISGDNFQMGKRRGSASYYFSRFTHIWGWATWRRAWLKYDYDLKEFPEYLQRERIKKIYTNRVLQDYWLDKFQQVYSKSLDTWDYQWTFAGWVNSGVCILPNVNLVSNLGFHAEATHTTKQSQVAELKTWPIKLPLKHAKVIAVDKEADNYTYYKIYGLSKEGLLMRIVRKVVRKIIRTIMDLIKMSSSRAEMARIKKLPRFTQGEAVLLNRKIVFADVASYLFMRQEIFGKEIYKFKTVNPKPVILDVGANIGLSLIYFKTLYPEAKILAFEPDPKIFSILKNNTTRFSCQNVELINAAVWHERKTMQFYTEGADAGRLKTDQDHNNIIEVQTVRLRDYLKDRVDFLKIDIEGAETEVIKDCQDLLANVENIFIEYHSFVQKEQTLDEILHLLRQAGFRYYIEHIGVTSDNPLYELNISNQMDNQINIFAYKNDKGT